MKIKNFYEIGKWQGDRVGFPRVGLVNKERILIKDTYEFLKQLVNLKRISIEIQRRYPEYDVSEMKNKLSELLRIKSNGILVTTNKHMRGKYVYRVFTQSRKLFRDFQQISDNMLLAKPNQIAQYLAGFADAEATVDNRNNIISFSISRKKRVESENIKKMLEIVLMEPVKMRTAGRIELKIEIPRNLVKLFKNKIGKFMKHPEKIKRFNGNFIPEKDKKILYFIKNNPNCTAKLIAGNFKIHVDSARRILRFFRKQKLVKFLKKKTFKYFL
ncbi:MAG: hypothetical protein ISS95_00910 [Candidatus Aenigmarchaeota archaeon]|nr:hypothetical protein [Candidatus Aenigmarchaeota archaeon]